MRLSRVVWVFSVGLAGSTMADSMVYRCLQNGKTVFTDTPIDASCHPFHLDVLTPNPAEVARMEEEERRAVERAAADREQAERDRLLRAQTEAAIAQTQVADAQRRWVEQRSDEDRLRDAMNAYGSRYGFGFGLPILTPWPPPLLPLPPTPTPPPPVTPVYPYGVDRIAPAGTP